MSLLPDFAQPYRLLASELIEDYFFERANRHLDSWLELLKSYRKGFEAWYEKLSAIVGFSLGRAPPISTNLIIDNTDTFLNLPTNGYKSYRVRMGATNKFFA